MRAAVSVMFFIALGVLGSCSSTADGCYSDSDCASGYLCDDWSGECRASTDVRVDSCNAPSDCPQSYTCGEERRCLPGDCYFHGCVAGFECQSSTGTWECLPAPVGGAGAGGSEDGAEAGTGGAAGQAG